MAKITIKYPLTVQIRIYEVLEATYSYVSTEYTADPGGEKATIIYNLNYESDAGSTFDQTFDQVLDGVTTTRAKIDIYLKDDDGNTVKSYENVEININ